MKMNIVKTFIVILAISYISCTDKFLEMEGSANNYGSKTVEAVNSSFAKTHDVVLTNDPAWGSPKILETLPLRQPIGGGAAVTIDEIPSSEIYYDGQMGIKESTHFCQQYITKPQACVSQGSCGWCMGSGNCVQGSNKGPVTQADCARGQYFFEAPNKDWNPITLSNTQTSRMNIMGAQLTTIVQNRDK
jgi:hypothetical protein